MFGLINLVVLFCTLSFVYCLVNIGEVQLYTTSLLPLTFLFLTTIFNNLYKSYSESIVFKLFTLQAIIRYCLLPVLISVDQVFVSKYNLFYLNIAILIMILELLFAFIVFMLFAKKQKNSFLNRKVGIIPLRGSVVLLLFICILFYYIYTTGAFNEINLIWNLSDYVNEYVTNDEDLASVGFGVVFFNLFKSLVALLFISYIYNTNKVKQSFKKWLYALVILSSGLFIVGTSRFSLVLFIIPLLVLVSFLLNNKDYKKIYTLTAILILGVLSVTTIAKFTRDNTTVSTESVLSTSSLNAYFSGPGNIVTGFEAYEKIEGYESLLYFFNDTFQNVPLLSKVTSNEYKGTLKFNEQYYGHDLYADQIIPLTTSGLFHFGVIGVLFYSTFFISIALYMERQLYKVDFIGYKYSFIYLSVNFSLVYMVNIGSFYGSLFGVFFFFLIPFYFINNFQKLKLRVSL